MSSLATAPRRAAPARVRAIAGNRAGPLRLSADCTFTLVLAGALVGVAFTTTGGVDLGPNTWAEIALVCIGAALGVVTLLRAPPGRLWGAGALILLGAVTALTLVSISWSVQPADSWVEANRSLAYLAAFGGAIALARLAPTRSCAVLKAIAIVPMILCGYALLVKVFPAALAPDESLGRLRAPLDYWNAVGLMAALGLPALLWLGARREGAIATRALAVPGIGVLVTALVLSYSRGALLVAVLGVACWFAVVPLRLRAALVLATGAAGGIAASSWALATRATTHDLLTLPSRVTAGHAFGLVLIALLALLGVGGILVAFAIDRFMLPAAARRRAGTALVMLVACLPLGAVVTLAISPRGLTGGVSHILQTLTSSGPSGVGDTAGRLVQVSNTRGRYWREGIKVGEHALLKGSGALGYGTARTRYSQDFHLAQHAHSYVIETFADFGLIGLALNLALLVAWAIAAGRAVGARAPSLGRLRKRLSALGEPGVRTRASPSVEVVAERAALLTLLVVVVTFGLHSAIDWTWFVPGTALTALVCAGWLAGRGPLSPQPGSAYGLPGASRLPASERVLVAALLTATALVSVWMIWQPLRSANADAAALTVLSKGDTRAALADARAAAARDPLSLEPLADLATIYGAAGNDRAAHLELVRAVRLQPANPAAWVALGEYDLQSQRAHEALAVLQAALYLGPHLPETLSALAQAQAGLQAQTSPPTSPLPAPVNHAHRR